MNVTLWGTRGSLAAPGPETARYGGNTSCVEVRGPEGAVLDRHTLLKGEPMSAVCHSCLLAISGTTRRKA